MILRMGMKIEMTIKMMTTKMAMMRMPMMRMLTMMRTMMRMPLMPKQPSAVSTGCTTRPQGAISCRQFDQYASHTHDDDDDVDDDNDDDGVMMLAINGNCSP